MKHLPLASGKVYSYEERMHIHNHSASSQLVKVIYELFHPQTIVDVGCGTGNFLSSFQSLGVSEILGIDGAWVDPHIRRKFIDDENFLVADLTNPPHLEKHFDLALCLEVGEHLPQSSANILVEFLTSLSDVIVFSAAIPNQDGPNHINCEWQNIWGERFAKQNFVVADTLRPMIWDMQDVPWWYRQNVFIAMRSNIEISSLGIQPHLHKVPALVHPELYSIKCDELRRIVQGDWPTRSYISMLLKSIFR